MKEFFREFSRFPRVILAIVFPGIASGGLSEIYLDFLCEVLQEQARPFLRTVIFGSISGNMFSSFLGNSFKTSVGYFLEVPFPLLEIFLEYPGNLFRISSGNAEFSWESSRVPPVTFC